MVSAGRACSQGRKTEPGPPAQDSLFSKTIGGFEIRIMIGGNMKFRFWVADRLLQKAIEVHAGIAKNERELQWLKQFARKFFAIITRTRR